MKFFNEVPVASARSRRQGTVSVAWQSVVLDEEKSPSLSERDRSDRGHSTEGQSFQQNLPQLDTTVRKWPIQNGADMALAARDDLIGGSVSTNEFGQDAHTITLHNQVASQTSSQIFSQIVGAPVVSSSLALASDSVNEVVNLYLQQAQSYCEEHQWEKALAACQEVLKVAPATAEAYKFMGKILQQQGRPTDAMGFYAKAITLRPNFPEVYSNLGSLYAQKGKWEEAVSYYKKAIERDPKLAIAYLNLAKIWKKLERKDSEMNCRITALRLKPDLGGAKDHFTLAQALEAENSCEDAVLFYRQAVDQDPKMTAAYQRLADLLEDAGDWQGAAECYRRVLALRAEADKSSAAQLSVPDATARSISPPTVGALPIQLSPENQQKVQNLLQISKTKKLIRPEDSEKIPSTSGRSFSLSEAVTLSPTELAQRYAVAKDWPQAIESLQAAIAQKPQSAILFRSLAKLFEQNKNPKQAAAAWYRSFVLEPDWPDAQQCFTLGRVLFSHGNTGAAIRCYRQSIQLQPDFVPALKALEQALQVSIERASSERAASPLLQESKADASVSFQYARNVAVKK